MGIRHKFSDAAVNLFEGFSRVDEVLDSVSAVHSSKPIHHVEELHVDKGLQPCKQVELLRVNVRVEVPLQGCYVPHATRLSTRLVCDLETSLMVIAQGADSFGRIVDRLAMRWEHEDNIIPRTQLFQGSQVDQQVIGMGTDGVHKHITTEEDLFLPFPHQQSDAAGRMTR